MNLENRKASLDELFQRVQRLTSMPLRAMEIQRQGITSYATGSTDWQSLLPVSKGLCPLFERYDFELFVGPSTLLKDPCEQDWQYRLFALRVAEMLNIVFICGLGGEEEFGEQPDSLKYSCSSGKTLRIQNTEVPDDAVILVYESLKRINTTYPFYIAFADSKGLKACLRMPIDPEGAKVIASMLDECDPQWRDLYPEEEEAEYTIVRTQEFGLWWD